VIDLHTHSRYSDGSDSPAELAERAAALGLSAIALTDHDTTAGLDEMAAACAERGVRLVRGVEVSLKDERHTRIDETGRESTVNVHVLGYFIPEDPASGTQSLLAALREDRVRRNIQLVELLNSLGFTRLSLDSVLAYGGSVESLGRPHFARAMIATHPEIVGASETPEVIGAIFTDWLAVGGRAYLRKTHTTIEQFVAAGVGEGVVFAIAHPLLNYARGASLDEIARVMPPILASLRERGLRGVEAHYGSCDEPTRRLMAKLARDAHMIPTGGSDYHGTYKPDVALGVGRAGDLAVPDEVLEELEAARTT
jgi:predicted metal-dependent phosphoesterase TrpH